MCTEPSCKESTQNLQKLHYLSSIWLPTSPKAIKRILFIATGMKKSAITVISETCLPFPISHLMYFLFSNQIEDGFAEV